VLGPQVRLAIATTLPFLSGASETLHGRCQPRGSRGDRSAVQQKAQNVDRSAAQQRARNVDRSGVQRDYQARQRGAQREATRAQVPRSRPSGGARRR
jgi:hypothetical protein